MLFVLGLSVLAACGGQGVYGDEAFVKESPYLRTFGGKPQLVCDAAQKALLSQGYRVERSIALQIKGKKEFQPDDDVNVSIDFELTCQDVESGTVIFASAVETTYNLKKTSASTSLSIPAAGSFSLPWSKSADSLVKVAGKTVTDTKFYGRFFDLVTNYLLPPETKAKEKFAP